MDNKDTNKRPTENVECGVDSNEKSGNYVAGLKRNRLPWWPLLLLILLLLFLFKDQLASLFSHGASPDVAVVDEQGHPIIHPDNPHLDDWIEDIITNPITPNPNNGNGGNTNNIGDGGNTTNIGDGGNANNNGNSGNIEEIDNGDITNIIDGGNTNNNGNGGNTNNNDNGGNANNNGNGGNIEEIGNGDISNITDGDNTNNNDGNANNDGNEENTNNNNANQNNPNPQNPLRNCDLIIILEWNGHTDLDLSVIDPCGRQVYKNNGSTCGGGGKMDIDANCNSNELKNNPKEVIHYKQPQTGNYRIKVSATRWRDNGSNTLPLKVYCISKRHGTKVFNASITPDQNIIVTNWAE